MSEQSKALGDRLVVGIDFGTTFSGVATAYSGSPDAPDEIAVIKTWPGGNNITSEKVPSEMTYNADSTSTNPRKRKAGDAFDFDVFGTKPAAPNTQGKPMTTKSSNVRWGFQVGPNEQRIRCLKLLLDPGQNIPRYVSHSDIETQLVSHGKDVPTAVTEYLSAVFAHAKQVLVDRYTELFVNTTKLQIVLTVPAVWSDAAQHATFQAAQGAGMGSDISLISEPEAAAVYALQSMAHMDLKVGDNFVVVDAGGGTVDLITYGIRQLTPLRFEEIVRGSGACCGAAFLNARFEDYVRSKMGVTAFDRMRRDKPRCWPNAEKYFEDYVKRNFDPDDPRDFNVPLPGVENNADAGIEDSFMDMSASEVAGLFKSLLEEVIALVKGQMLHVRLMSKKVKAVVLVGGFGQSECLKKVLRAHLNKEDEKIQIVRPANAWSAVVRGAVLRGLEGSELVLNRKARRHYGVSAAPLYQPSVHSYSNKYWDEYEDCWRARNQMTWYIRQGGTVSATEPVIFPFYKVFTSDHKTVTNELIICDTKDAPKEFGSAADSSTKVICKLVTNLSTVLKHLWKSKKNSKGRRYQELHYELGMQIESGGLRFDLRVDDVVYGKVTTSFT